MHSVILICLMIIVQNFGEVESNSLASLTNSDECTNNVCSKEDQVENNGTLETSIDNPSTIQNKNFSENKNEDSLNYFNYSSNTSDNQKKTKDVQIFLDEVNNSKNLEEIKDFTENETESFTSKTEITNTDEKLTSENSELSSTTSLYSTEKNFKSTIKPTTTHMPPLEFFSLQNSTTGKNICFCDLILNQCDINCCCDEDCSPYHFKVFTKCNDVNDREDNRYCFKSNFIFKNNTFHKIIQSQGELFCILRDNSKLSYSYKTKPVIGSLETFNKSLPKKFYTFSFRSLKRPQFAVIDYKAGAPVWIIRNGEIKAFAIPAPTVGFLCTSQLNVKYLVNQVTKCTYQLVGNECKNSKIKNVFHFLKGIKVISNPSVLNISYIKDTEKACQNGICIGITPYICQPSSNISCIKITEKVTNFPKIACLNLVPKIQYHIWHNGSEGIKKIDAYVWLRNLSSEKKEQLLQMTEIKYFWTGSSVKIFEKSGNPGYLKGKPILAGRKIYHALNSTSEKKETIQLPLDSSDWLSVLGSEKGICSSKKRIQVNFMENSQYMCSLKLTKDNFSKEKCIELQNYIFKLLIGKEIVNATSNTYFNKFVATFGNSKVEETGDWAQVLIDLSPIISSHVGFKSNYNNLMCKNIITDLFIDIAYASIGSLKNPQSKILGVSFHFGKYKDLTFYCDTPSCEKTSIVQYFKLSSVVHFIDTTEPAVDAFAEPLSFEAKLPHDFFYPFFSKSSGPIYLNIYVFVFIFAKFF